MFGMEPVTVPRHTLPPGEMSPQVAYQIVHDELMLDGNARLNLATFVTTWAEPQAELLMAECLDKNMIDKDEYPQTAELEVAVRQHAERPVARARRGAGDRVLDHRFERGGDARRPRAQAALAEGARGGGQAGRPAQHRDGHQRPGLLGEVRQLLGRRDAPGADGGQPLPPRPRTRRSRPATRTRSASSPSSARPSTARTSRSRRSARRWTPTRPGPGSTSRCTSTARRAPSSPRSSTRTWSGTSGSPGWRRSTRRVTSTGWCTPASGWAIWRDADALPEDLIFWVNYLGDNMPTFALNFSRPGAQVVAQYYNFLRLGFDGYRRVQQYARDVGHDLSGADRRARAVRAAHQGR